MSVDTPARTKTADVIDRLRPYIVAAQRGDQAAFRHIYQEYARSVYNLVFRCVRNPQAAEDVCQEVWVKAFRELPKLQDVQAFPAWLYRIAARACVDASRKNRRVAATAQIPDEVLLDTNADTDPERSALRRERVRLTWEAMATMPTRQHVALYLREMHSMNYAEIAQMLGTSQPAVEMLLFRARQGFAKAYQRLEAAGQERCSHARHSMAALIDGEATSVQRNAIRAHVDTCRPCSGELTQMRRTAASYAALLPLPIPAILGDRIFESIGAAGAGASASAAPASVAKLLTLAAAKAKVASLALVATAATTAATVGAMNSPIADGLLPETSSTHSKTQTDSINSEFQTLGRPAGSMPTNPGSTGAGDDATQNPAAEDHIAVPLDPNIAEVPEPIDRLTESVTATVDQTTADINQTVDTILHELEAASDALPTVPPLPAVPPLPVAPPPLPTLPPLPTPTIPPLPPLP